MRAPALASRLPRPRARATAAGRAARQAPPGMAEAAADDGRDKSLWPEQTELEKWLMRTAKDADDGATFLRKMLQMNPAYGAFLVEDESLSGIVQNFAKRFRNKILGSELQSLRNDPSGKILYEPLCEVSWRVVGHVLSGILELEEGVDHPVSKEAVGQVKMLLNTNIALSKKFNEMRRAYLRELSVYRDKQRHLDEQKLAAINSLQEDPIMFYEPLEFVLDETTKAFVNEVIEERLKLGMKFESKPKPDVEKEAGDVEDPEKARMIAEMRQLRTQAAREQANAEKFENEAKRAKAAMEKATAALQVKEDENEELRKEVENLKKQRNDLNKQLQGKESKETTEVFVDSPTHVVKEQVIVDNSERFKGALKDAEDEMARLRERIAALEKEKKDRHKELESMRQEWEQATNKPAEQTEKKQKEVVEKKVEKKPKKDNSSELDDLKEQIAEALQVEKELRAANKALEKALNEAKEKGKYRGPKGDAKDIDDEIAKAIADITEQYKKQLREKDVEIDRLRELLENLKQKKEKVVEEEPEKKQKKAKENVVVAGDSDKAKEWKQKHDDLQEKYDDLEHEYEKLQNQIRILLEKIKKYGGEAALAEVMAEVKITAMPPRKQRKKKAWERLYEDAQRRILHMTMRRQELEKQEKKLLISAASRVTDRKSMRQVENLTHLHKASVSTQNRFQDALKNFHNQYESSPIAEGNEDSGIESGEEGFRLSGTFGSSFGGSPWADSDPIPGAVAEEFHRLRAENRLLMQELSRLRGMLPNSAPTGAGMDAAFLGVWSTPLGTKDMVRRAESGINMGGSLGAAMAVGQSPSESRTPSPNGSQRGKLSGADAVSGPVTGPLRKAGGSGTKQAQLAGIGGRSRQPPSPSNERSQSPQSDRERQDLAATAGMPWRQSGGSSPGAMGSTQSLGNMLFTSTPKAGATSRDLGMSASATQLFGTAPQLGGAAPWRASPAGPPSPPPPPAGASAPPSGWNALSPKAQRAAAHERSPSVIGRAPSVGALEPIGGSRPGSRLFIGEGSAEVWTGTAVGSGAPAVPEPMAAARAPAPALAATLGSFSASALPTATALGGAAGALAATSPAGSMSRQIATAKATEPQPPRNFLTGPVKPKAKGMCVTALRSQQHLTSL